MALSKEVIAEALKESGGFVREAAEILGCSHVTIYNWFKKHPELKESRDTAKMELLDLAKSTSRRLLKEGNVAMSIYILKSLGKNEGFAERQELTGKDGERLIERKWEFLKPKMHTNGVTTNGKG